MSAPRVAYQDLTAKAYQSLLQASGAVKKGSLDPILLDLVFLRVSQINGCAYCVDMHWSDLVKLGEAPRRLNSVVTWRETVFFSEPERAALHWAEVLTHLGPHGAPEQDYQPLLAQFDEQQIAELTMAIAIINAWNRLGVGLALPLPA